MIDLAVILNGPPSSAKDYLANGVVSLLSDDYIVAKRQFKDELFNCICDKYGNEIYHEFVSRQDDRGWKESPHPLLNGMTPRQALIDLSENEIKPKFGKDYFGRAMAERLENIDLDICIFSDCGFQEEIQCLIDSENISHVLLVHLSADGCSFDGDSRRYVSQEHLTDWNEKLSVFPFFNGKACISDVERLANTIRIYA